MQHIHFFHVWNLNPLEKKVAELTASEDEQPGTSQTLNDALALGTELGSGIGAGEIEERLAAWEAPRKERVKTIQKMERASWTPLRSCN
jgi:hypothetical protein